MALRFNILAGALALAGMASIGAAQPAGGDTKAPAASGAAEAGANDPNNFLEEIQGERALTWARA
jgi:hypothetical protein